VLRIISLADGVHDAEEIAAPIGIQTPAPR
jgi:hypothetical protein